MAARGRPSHGRAQVMPSRTATLLASAPQGVMSSDGCGSGAVGSLMSNTSTRPAPALVKSCATDAFELLNVIVTDPPARMFCRTDRFVPCALGTPTRAKKASGTANSFSDAERPSIRMPG